MKSFKKGFLGGLGIACSGFVVGWIVGFVEAIKQRLSDTGPDKSDGNNDETEGP